jgi:hypothetical protein
MTDSACNIPVAFCARFNQLLELCQLTPAEVEATVKITGRADEFLGRTADIKYALSYRNPNSETLARFESLERLMKTGRDPGHIEGSAREVYDRLSLAIQEALRNPPSRGHTSRGI